MEGNGEKLNLSGRRVNGVSRYLMPKIENEAHLTNGNNQQRKHEAERNEENIELNLGLSTNGRFGVDPSAKKLKRSSSASSLDPDAGPAGNGGEARPHGEARATHPPLARASSLPADMEGLWRRRRRPDREMESARSMEARKKRMEKMKSGRGVVRKRGIYLSGGSGLHEGGNGGVDLRFPDNVGVGGGGSEDWMMVQSSQGPVMGSQRGSAGIPVPHGQAMMGVDQNTMMRSSSSCQIPNEQVVAGPAPDNNNNKRAEKQKLLKNALLDMPHVSTGSNNHSRVEGILYRYRRADELRIVCVCHGLFLSPAEFVRHGGGGDVDQPLKHIVVNPFPLFQV